MLRSPTVYSTIAILRELVSYEYAIIKYEEGSSETRVNVVGNPSIMQLYEHVNTIHSTLPKKFIKL